MRALPMQSNPMQSIPTSPRVVSSSVWSACGFEASIEPLLVARAAGGEHGAFGLLYQRHVDRVYQYVFFRVRNADLAEDLTQEIFISAYRAIAGLQHADRFVPWLLTIARNRLLNHWRAAQRTADAVRPDDIDDALADVAGEDELSALESHLHEKVTWKRNTLERNAQPAADVAIDDRERDRNAGAPLQHIVQTTVARIVVIRCIRGKTQFTKKVPVQFPDPARKIRLKVDARSQPGCHLRDFPAVMTHVDLRV